MTEKTKWSLVDYGKWILAAITLVGAVVAALLFRRKGPSPLQQYQDRKQLIDVEARYKKIAIDQGTEAAVERIKVNYARQVHELETKEKDRVEELKKKPHKLAGAALRALQSEQH